MIAKGSCFESCHDATRCDIPQHQTVMKAFHVGKVLCALSIFPHLCLGFNDNVIRTDTDYGVRTVLIISFPAWQNVDGSCQMIACRSEIDANFRLALQAQSSLMKWQAWQPKWEADRWRNQSAGVATLQQDRDASLA